MLSAYSATLSVALRASITVTHIDAEKADALRKLAALWLSGSSRRRSE